MSRTPTVTLIPVLPRPIQSERKRTRSGGNSKSDEISSALDLYLRNGLHPIDTLHEKRQQILARNRRFDSRRRVSRSECSNVDITLGSLEKRNDSILEKSSIDN